MSIKKTKYRVGPFERGHVEIDMYKPSALDAALELLKANSPADRIATWRPHAERLGVAVDLLDEAQELIDKNGEVQSMGRFDGLLARAELAIERAQNESLNVYGLAGSRAKHSEELRHNATARNRKQKRKSQEINSKLIAWDDAIAKKHPGLTQPQRARKILWDHKDQLPTSIAESKPTSLVSRLNRARKERR